MLTPIVLGIIFAVTTDGNPHTFGKVFDSKAECVAANAELKAMNDKYESVAGHAYLCIEVKVEFKDELLDQLPKEEKVPAPKAAPKKN